MFLVLAKIGLSNPRIPDSIFFEFD